MADPHARPGPGHSPSGPGRGPYGTPPPNAYPPPGPQTGNGYAPLGAPAPAPAPQPQGKNVVRSSLLMGAGSLVSRVTGFGRTVVISAAIGAGLLGNSYTTAQYFPQMIYELVLGGVFASIIMPLFVKAHKNDPDGGDAFAQRLLTLATLVLGAAAVVVTLCAPIIARFMSSPEQYDLVTEFSYYMLPALLLYGLFAVLSGVLNSREHFGAPMWVPIINNLVVIAVGALFYVIYTRDAVPNADGDIFVSASQVTNGMIMLLGLGTTAGVVIQVVCLAPALRKAGFHWRLRFDFKALPLREIRRMAAWTLLFVAANQVAVMAVIKVANAASAVDSDVFVPGVTVYNNAYLMMMMAHGIVAVSVITALMPRMTRAADDRRWPELADHLSNGIRLASFLLVPIAAAFVALHEPIALAIFQWGAYQPAEAIATGQVLLMAGVVLLPFSISQLQIYAFYAQTDTKAVAMFSLPVIAIRIGGYLLAFAFLPAQWVVVGLFASNGVSYLVSLLLSMTLLRKRIGLLGMRKTLNGLVRTGAAAVIAGGVAYGGWLLWPELPSEGGMAKLGQFGATVVLGIVLLGVYFAACLVFRVTETASLQATVRAKLRR
ncbi:murein biosynthesis integral membrane protein MurJ [Glycomyces sp. NPDC048151]|uniref:murein biosynthesis integral membrane protein MurJ n=1 Tax=Glycomyces sp. NPDC048151 TaxID=3364002 RepID=UPI00371DB02B